MQNQNSAPMAVSEAARPATRRDLAPEIQETLYSSAMVGFVAWDDVGSVVAANQEFCRLTGIDATSLDDGVEISAILPGIARDTSDLSSRVAITRKGAYVTLNVEVHAQARQALVTDVTSEAAAEQALTNARDLLETQAVAITGTDAIDLVPLDRLRDAHSTIKRQQIEIEELLARVADAYGELESFSYSVSHDLRAPLRAVDGFTGELIDGYGAQLDSKAQHYLERIRAAARRLDRIIDDLLRLSRVNRAKVRRQPADLAAIARGIVGDLSASSKRRVEWVIPDRVDAECDPDLMRLVLQNLLQNAWKFTAEHEQARIELRAEEGPHGTVYSVVDDGVGFDMKYADKLFGPFQRLHSPARFEGTGIGLATVKRIIHRHGGKVWAESAPDAGTKVFFTLGRPSKEGNP